MEDLIGFVSGNKNRQKLLALLGSKNKLDAEKMAKNMHVAYPSVNKIIQELLEKGLIKKDENIYSLTELGESVERKIQSI
ncbi:MAG: winged helix-turn-helix domain-containing protein [Methanolobus sp.]|nr:winged helix-turn-helix domain-containing protein [Methanolobus sp.]